MERTSTVSINLAVAFLCAVFAACAYRAATQSITNAEAVAFDRFVRPPLRDTLAQFDPENLLLNTVLVKRTVALLRLSEFSFRLPNLLAAALYLWAVFRISRRLFGNGMRHLLAVVVLSLNPLLLAGSGLGIGLGFYAAGVDQLLLYLLLKQKAEAYHLNLGGICLGVAAAASLTYVLPAALLAIGFVPATSWRLAVDRVIVPMLVIAFLFLAIPLTHAPSAPPLLDLHPAAYRPWRSETGARSLIGTLRRQAGSRPIRIGASPDLDPIVTFYRARYRIANWQPMRQLPLTNSFDYYVLAAADWDLVPSRHLQVLWRNSGMLLASDPPAGTRP